MIDTFLARKQIELTISLGLKHGEYAQSVEIARLSQMFMSGEGQSNEYLIDLRPGETETSKNLRVRVTKPITPLALSPVMNQYAKMFRVDGSSFDVNVDGDGGAKDKLTAAIDTYHAGNSLLEYNENRYLWWVFNDPNGWHITERRNQVDATGLTLGVDVFPLEVSSQQAINMEYDNGVPVWLIVEHKRIEFVKDGMETKQKEVSDFYLYAAGLTVKYAEYISEMNIPEGTNDEQLIQVPVQGMDDRKFVVQEFLTGSTEFPGQKWGAFNDPGGSKTLKVPPFWEGAKPLLERLIRNDSIFQVSVYNHVFPKLFHYDYSCNHVDDEYGECQGGNLGGVIGRICPSCKGRGGAIHVSESDVIKFNLPENMEDMSKLPDLSKMAYYHLPPLDVTNALYQWSKDLLEWVHMASFNVSNVEKAVAQRTATEIDMLNDNINARVYSCLKQYAAMCERTVRVAAQYLEVNGVVVSYIVPADMRLEGLDVLVDRFKRMKEAGLSYEAIWAIHCAILSKTHTGNQKAVEEIKAWEFWRPFKSYEQNLALLILQNRSGDDRSKILYENWDEVRTNVILQLGEQPFYLLPKDRQLNQINDALARVGAGIVLALPEQGGFDFQPDEPEQADKPETA